MFFGTSLVWGVLFGREWLQWICAALIPAYGMMEWHDGLATWQEIYNTEELVQTIAYRMSTWRPE